VHFTLTGSSWINQVECWFGYRTDQKIRCGVHESDQALEADIRGWIEQWNENPRQGFVKVVVTVGSWSGWRVPGGTGGLRAG